MGKYLVVPMVAEKVVSMVVSMVDRLELTTAVVKVVAMVVSMVDDWEY